MTAPDVLGIPNGMFEENTWLVWDGASRAAVVIDPGEESARILREIQDRHLQVESIWLTHAHLDHVWGVDDLRSATHARVLLHGLDRAWYDRAREQALYYGITAFPESRSSVMGSASREMFSSLTRLVAPTFPEATRPPSPEASTSSC